VTSLFSRLQKLNPRCLFGHDWHIRTYISSPQPRGVNCEGDDWYVGSQCARCYRWRAFKAGRAFGMGPMLDALREIQ
jgi:hypothetical protein